MKLLTLLLVLSTIAISAQVEKKEIQMDTMYHLFDENNKYIDHSKSKDSLKQRNYLIPGKLYFLEKFFGPENQKKTQRCKLNVNDKADTASLKWSI